VASQCRAQQSDLPQHPICLNTGEWSLLFCLQVSGNSAHILDDTVVEVTPTAQWEDTSSCSEGHEDTSPSSPEHVSCALQKLSGIEILTITWHGKEIQNVWLL
jgi:hypothetical protein